MREGLAAVVRDLNGVFNIEPVEFSDPVSREVLVEVKAAGLCHSDMNVATVDRGRALPLVPGHELAGVVLEVGPAVQNLKVGDHVVGTEVRSCGKCIQCVQGQPTFCVQQQDLERSPQDGPRVRTQSEEIHALGVASFASYSVADERLFVPIPQEVPFPEGSILGCAVSTGMGSVLNVAKVAPGDAVVVFGIGGVGLNIISAANLAGASVIIAVDVGSEKLSIARDFGATHSVLSNQDTLAQIKNIIPAGVDHAFDVVGVASVTEMAMRSTVRGGSTYLIGIPAPGSLLSLDTMADMIGHQRSLQGVFMGGTNPQRDIRMYADLFLSGKLRLSDMISEHIGIHDINHAYQQTRQQQKLRTVVTNFSDV